MTQIALTGGTGFLGAHVADALIGQGHSLRALVRDTSRAVQLREQGAALVVGDLNDKAALRELITECDCVVHIAGAIKAKTAAELLAINGGGTANLVAACADIIPDIRLVHVSSVTAREPGLSAYANSKAASEISAKAHAGPLVIVRPNAVYGPGDRETLQVFEIAEAWMQPVLNQPQARIAMIHGKDAGNAIAAMAVAHAPIGLFEISDRCTAGYSWTQITQAAVASVGGQYRPIPIPVVIMQMAGFIAEQIGRFRREPQIFNSGKVREILHGDWAIHPGREIPAETWTPKINLQDGFTQTVDWYRQQGWLKG